MPNYSSGTISIPNVTGNIVITATATAATGDIYDPWFVLHQNDDKI
jgi:hypothetical protein